MTCTGELYSHPRRLALGGVGPPSSVLSAPHGGPGMEVKYQPEEEGHLQRPKTEEQPVKRRASKRVAFDCKPIHFPSECSWVENEVGDSSEGSGELGGHEGMGVGSTVRRREKMCSVALRGRLVRL